MNTSYNQMNQYYSNEYPPLILKQEADDQHYHQPSGSCTAKDETKTKKKKKTSVNGGRGGGGVRLSTDPQSVAARERRHKISDRLKTLQSMVPGAAKLDTVSVLDHAIQYVHFLRSQIRFHQYFLLVSNSDDVIVDPPLVDIPPPEVGPSRPYLAGAWGEEEGCFGGSSSSVTPYF